jgi:hypothetical protein
LPPIPPKAEGGLAAGVEVTSGSVCWCLLTSGVTPSLYGNYAIVELKTQSGVLNGSRP